MFYDYIRQLEEIEEIALEQVTRNGIITEHWVGNSNSYSQIQSNSLFNNDKTLEKTPLEVRHCYWRIDSMICNFSKNKISPQLLFSSILSL